MTDKGKIAPQSKKERKNRKCPRPGRGKTKKKF